MFRYRDLEFPRNPQKSYEKMRQTTQMGALKYIL